nr:MAG TPA: hypothetical protein [Caudoviricetes sp.]
MRPRGHLPGGPDDDAPAQHQYQRRPHRAPALHRDAGCHPGGHPQCL